MKLSGLIEEQSDKALEIQSLTSFENTKSTFIVSLINSFKSLICTGILILPYIFYTGGYLLCTIFLFVIAIAIGYTCILFHEVIEQHNDRFNFEDVIGLLLGTQWESFYNILQINLTLGVGIAYFIFITRYSTVIFLLFGIHINPYLNVLLVTILVFFTSLVRNFDKLKYFSFVGFAIILITAITFSIFGIYHMNQGIHQKLTSQLLLGNIYQAPLVFGTLVYSFEFIQTVSYIRSNMEEPKKFPSLIYTCFITVFILYLTFGLIQSYSINSIPKSIFFYNYNQKNEYWVFIFQTAYVFVVYFSFSLNTQAMYILLEKQRFYKEFQNRQAKFQFIRKNFVRIICVLFMALIAMLAPKFEQFIGLIGSSSGTILQFIYPVLLYNTQFKDTMTTNRKIANYSALIFGIVGGFSGTLNALSQISRHHK